MRQCAAYRQTVHYLQHSHTLWQVHTLPRRQSMNLTKRVAVLEVMYMLQYIMEISVKPKCSCQHLHCETDNARVRKRQAATWSAVKPQENNSNLVYMCVHEIVGMCRSESCGQTRMDPCMSIRCSLTCTFPLSHVYTRTQSLVPSRL